MVVSMTESGRELTMIDIHKIETQIGKKLPEPYKDFLLKHNGGRPNPDCFPIEGEDVDQFGGVQFFFGLNLPIKALDILWNYRTFHKRVPNNILPIACDGSGNIICMSLRKSDYENIYFWDHERELTQPGKLYIIKDNFSSFIDCLATVDEMIERFMRD